MPFVIGNPHSAAATTDTGPRGPGRIKKKDRHPPYRHQGFTYQQQRQQRRHQQQQIQKRPRSDRARDSRTALTFGNEIVRRPSSLGDVISGIVQHQYLNYRQKKPQGTKSNPPSRSSTTSQLSKLQPQSAGRRATITGSASFSFGFYQHRLSSISASSSVAASTAAVIRSGISSFSEQEATLAEQISPRETAARSSSPRVSNEGVIGEANIVMPSSARVAFGSFSGGATGENSRRTTYMHMGETATPSVFLTGISSQCLHTLYAGSFVVYATNLAADWLHTYYACKGWSVTFSLKAWLTIFMICCCAIGGICNFLLLYLCIESALRRKWEGSPFRGGFRLIFQRFANWILDFDCFRISFLILVLENAPMTFINYWFISSCSIPRPGKIGWTFAFACGATILSIIWRGLMTFFAYKNLRCFRTSATARRKTSKRAGSAAAYFPLQQTPSATTMTIGEIQHQKLEARTSGSSTTSTLGELKGLASGDRIHYYDECWPVRMSCWIMYNQRDDLDPDPSEGGGRGENGESSSTRPTGPNLPVVRPPDNCLGYCCQASCCVCLCVLFYAAMIGAGCAPCAYHYTCRRNSRLHRHKFARTCTRSSSLIFNVVVVIVSVFLVISLLVMNLIWLSSVQVIGHNRMPPEISQICLVVQPELHSVHPALMTSIIPRDERRPLHDRTECKPLFELNNKWGFWWQRNVPGPWLYQGTYVNDWFRGIDQLAVKTEAAIGRGADETTKIYVQFVHGTTDDCQYKVYNNWTIIVEPPVVQLPWPYWTACEKSYVVDERFTDCQKGQID